jgi:hypothetical protein
VAAVAATNPEEGPLADLDREGSRYDYWDDLRRQLRRDILDQDEDYERDLRPQLGRMTLDVQAEPDGLNGKALLELAP